ncbi:MAG: hypothetical protein QOJ07_2605 [Thermoleophilaceae bacterium]|nr:hypothetical protein [Thermoleophilaceae bacterium]
MEAATPLRTPSVRTLGDRLVVDGVVIADDCAVRLVRERDDAGDDPVRTIVDAIEIGARVLDREQAAANADFVRNEFEKVSTEVENSFSVRAREVADELGKKVDEVFAPDTGHVTKALERHFSDGSSSAVQNRVREVVSEVMTRSREDLLKQFSSADGQNPLADFKAHTLRQLEAGEKRQHETMRALYGKLGEMQRELQALRDEREKLEEVAAERERGTAKGREFEELVVEALDTIAVAQGDDCDAVGDVSGSIGRTGDVVVELDACHGPARGRIVWEAKDRRLSKPKALEELDRAIAQRDADFAVLVVPSDEEVPARLHALREYNGDKLIVVWDPESESRLPLEVAYSLARARVLMAKSEAEGIDGSAVRDTVERALAAMDEVRKVKSSLTGAKTQIDRAAAVIDAMSDRVRDHLRAIDDIVAAASGEDEREPAYVEPAQTELM